MEEKGSSCHGGVVATGSLTGVCSKAYINIGKKIFWFTRQHTYSEHFDQHDNCDGDEARLDLRIFGTFG